MTMLITDDAYNKDLPLVLYDNLMARGTLLSATAADGYDVENCVSGTTWDFYKPAALGLAAVRVEMASSEEADCALIDAHDMFTNGSYFRIECSDDGSVWTDLTGWIYPEDNGACMAIWPASSHLFWRVLFNNPTAQSRVGVIVLGLKLSFPNGIDSAYRSIPHSRTYTLLGGDSDSGQFTGQNVIRKGATVSPTFPLLDASWVDSDMKAFEAHYNEGLTFAWAAMPSMYPDDMGYCKRPADAGELRPGYYEGGMYQEFTMQLKVFIND